MWLISQKKDVLETLDIRIALEDFVMRKIPYLDENITKRMKDNLTLFRKTIERKDIIGNNETDSAFHLLIVGLARNKVLCRVYGGLHSHLGVQRLLHANEKKALEELWRAETEHAKIVQAFEEKDKKEIRRTVKAHLTNVKQRVAKAL